MDLATGLDCARQRDLGSDTGPSAVLVQPALDVTGAGIEPGRWYWYWVNTSLGCGLPYRFEEHTYNAEASSSMCRVEAASV